jgi:hypothetical protein
MATVRGSSAGVEKAMIATMGRDLIVFRPPRRENRS